jgi:cytochrome c oxidase cbb3-type subunit 3
MSCHSEEMLAQQRLPKAKWEATVKKMAGWGANLDPGDEGALVAWLAETYGPDAAAYEPARISASAAAAELAPDDDPAFAGGDAAHGRALFVERCLPCHGEDARGQIGVNLVEKPVLHRARAFAETVRRGRGKMLPIAATDREIADVLAHLRTLRVR